MIIPRNEDVLRLYVAMHHFVQVQVLQPGNDVVQVLHRMVFGKDTVYC